MLQSVGLSWAEMLSIRQDLDPIYTSELLFQKRGVCFLLGTNTGGEIGRILSLHGINNCADHNGQMLCMELSSCVI